MSRRSTDKTARGTGCIRYDEAFMAYRDRPITCPRCRVQLQRHAAADRWRCAMCSGIVLGIPEVVRELLVIAPDLLPRDGVAGLRSSRVSLGDPC